MSWMHPVAMNAQRGRRESLHYKARDCQIYRGVCTKKSGLNASGHSYSERHIVERSAKNTACFERPVKQALALATEPRAKQETRSVLYYTYQ